MARVYLSPRYKVTAFLNLQDLGYRGVVTENSVLGPIEIHELASQLGVRPTKTLGQNFVHDANTVRRIVAGAGVSSEDTVVEVGPGLGSLTLAILEATKNVIAVEIDPVLAQQLPYTLDARAAGHQAIIINDDALVITREMLHKAGAQDPNILVANLPYNVAVPVLLHLLEVLPTLKRALVMVQAEVADRLAADPGSRIYGIPSVKAGFYGRVRRAGAVPRAVFWPIPNVDSGLVRLDAWEEGEVSWDVTDEVLRKKVFAAVDAAFAQRRKTLRAALANWAGSPALAEERLRAAGIDPSLRGERLTTADYVRLVEASE